MHRVSEGMSIDRVSLHLLCITPKFCILSSVRKLTSVWSPVVGLASFFMYDIAVVVLFLKKTGNC